MANAVEEALKRANADQRAHIEQTIEEAQRAIYGAQVQMGNSPSGDASATIARNQQIIEEARRSIPFETMQSVDSISPPMNTPPMHGMVNSEPVELNPEFKSNIERIEQGGGNNYLHKNAVDRALERSPQDIQSQDQEKTMER